ncbi:hypothetical protein FKM82_009731 [Ascaphus truei]
MFFPARNMTKATSDRLDLSFLDETETSQILEVLQRDEQLRRAERERVSKLQRTKRDLKWLHGVTGEWFEEIQRKKFKNDPGVWSLLKQPMTYRLKKKSPKDSEDSKMSKSRTLHSPKSSISGPSVLGIRSPFTSLFSFRKSRKQNVKPQSQQESPVGNQISSNIEENKKFDMYHSTRHLKQPSNLFTPDRNRTRESEISPTNAQLEREIFQVLGDLDQKLAQEQSQQFRTTRTSTSYRPGGHYHNEDSHSNMPECKRDYSRTSFLHDGARTSSLGEGYKTHSTYQPRKFNDMYSNRHRTASQQQPSEKNMFERSPSLCSDLGSKSRISSSPAGTFSASSLHLPSLGQSSYELEKTEQRMSRRTPISSITWNGPFSPGHIENDGKPLRTQSATDLNNHNSSSHQIRMFELYKYKNSHREPTSNTNEFEKVNYANDVTSRIFHKNTDGSHFGTNKAASPDLPPFTNIQMENKRVWGEVKRENKAKSNPDVEPMETCENECPAPSAKNVVVPNLQTNSKATFTVKKVSDEMVVPCYMQTPTGNNVASAHLTNGAFNNPESVMHYKENARDSTLSSGTKNNRGHDLQLAILHRDQSNYETVEVDLTSVSTQTRDSKNYCSNTKSYSFKCTMHTFSSKSTSHLSSAGHNTSNASSLIQTQQHTPYSGPMHINRDVPPCASQNTGNLDCSNKHAGAIFTGPCRYNSPSIYDHLLARASGLKNSVSNKTSSTFYGSTPDISEKHTCSKLRRHDRTKHELKGYSSVMLKDQSRNSSSLPNLTEGRNSFYNASTKNTALKTNELKTADIHPTVIPDQTSAIISSKPNEVYLKENRNVKAYHAQTTTGTYGKHEALHGKTIQGGGNPSTFSCEITSNRAPERGVEKGVESKEMPISDEKIHIDIKESTSKIRDTQCSDLHVQSKYTSCNRETYDSLGGNGGDTNNNRQSTEKLCTDNKLCKDVENVHNVSWNNVARWNDSRCSDRMLDRHLVSNNSMSTIMEKENTYKPTPYANRVQQTTPSKQDLSLPYQRDVVSVTSQQKHDGINNGSMFLPDNLVKSVVVNSSCTPDHSDLEKEMEPLSISTGMQNKRDFPSKTTHSNMTHTLTHDMHNYTNIKESGAVHTPKPTDGSTFYTRGILEERLQKPSSNKAVSPSSTQNTSTSLVKQHFLLASEPNKVSTNIKGNLSPQWNFPASPEEVNRHQSSCATHSPTSNVITNISTEGDATYGNVHTPKAHCTSSNMQNKQTYETSSTISVMSDPDKMKPAYDQMYNTLPRRYSKRLSDFSQNHMTKIDRTLEISKAPSALLEKIVSRYPETKERSKSEHQNVRKPTSRYNSENMTGEEFISENIAQSKPESSSLPASFLHSRMVKTSERSFSDIAHEEKISTSYNLVDKFNSLQVSERHSDHNLKEDPLTVTPGIQIQRNNVNENRFTDDYSNYESSCKHKWNAYYYTLPNRKSSTKEFGKNVFAKDVANAHEKWHMYSHKGKQQSMPQQSNYCSSLKKCNDNLNHSPTSDFKSPVFHESDEKSKNMNNLIVRDSVLVNNHSVDDSVIDTDKSSAVYRSKSLRDLNLHEPYDIVGKPNLPCNDNSMRPLGDSQSNLSKIDQILNRTRPSFCSKYIQNEARTPGNARRFNFSFDQNDQCDFHSLPFTDPFGNYSRMADDPASPSVFHATNDNYHTYLGRHFHGRGSPAEHPGFTGDQSSNLYRSKSLKILNLEEQQDLTDFRRKNDRRFSSKTYVGKLSSRSPTIFTDPNDTKCNQRLSAELISDDNDNWSNPGPGYIRKAVYTSKSVDYGIFGKEQQVAFLNTIKRSLTEGRLWRPSFLKNPGFLRNENYSHDSQMTSCSSEGTVSQGPSPRESLNIYEEEAIVCSDSDTDTTTDDEYYLDENDKESEL